MTTKELKILVAESPKKEWLQDYNFVIDFPLVNFTTSIKGAVSIYEFLMQQIEGFEKIENLAPALVESKDRFINARDNILNAINEGNFSEYVWDNNLALITNYGGSMFLYNSAETEFLQKTYTDNSEYYDGALDFISGSTNNPTNKNYFVGYLLAYEFISKDFSKITERKNAEKKSISSTRSDFQAQLNSSELLMTDYLEEAKSKFVEYITIIDELKQTKEDLYNTWFTETSNGFNTFNDKSLSNIEELEKLYREKLKLEAPAKYWSERAKKLRSEGYAWLAGLMLSISIGVFILIWALNEIAVGTLDKVFQNAGTGIKWSVLFITLVSFVAFAIKTFSKLTFSSFHLVRDAEERQQLTYVYLALKKEKDIDESERLLVMQSLFSRAETGLLKDDSGPTMPGNIADKIITR